MFTGPPVQKFLQCLGCKLNAIQEIHCDDECDLKLY